MNRNQSIALAIAVANLLLMTLFPPIDQYSVASSVTPVFAGFYFIAGKPLMSVINTDLLTIQVIVVLITGVNLVLMLLFPPMESVFALTRAAIPTFEGFYFIFSQKPAHVIVETLLYLEIIFILVNGALLWLIFRDKRPPSDQKMRATMQQFAQK
jgi:hypothetical protein